MTGQTPQDPGQQPQTEAERVLKEQAEQQAELVRKRQQEEPGDPGGQAQAIGVNADQEGLGGAQDPAAPQPAPLDPENPQAVQPGTQRPQQGTQPDRRQD